MNRVVFGFKFDYHRRIMTPSELAGCFNYLLSG